MAAAISTMITSVSRMANWRRGTEVRRERQKGAREAGFGSLRHRSDHAVVLLPGAAAAEEGHEEDHHPDGDDDDGDSGGRRVLDLEGVVQADLHQDADHDQGEAAQLQGGEEERGVRVTAETQQLGTHTHHRQHLPGRPNQERMLTLHLNRQTDENLRTNSNKLPAHSQRARVVRLSLNNNLQPSRDGQKEER